MQIQNHHGLFADLNVLTAFSRNNGAKVAAYVLDADGIIIGQGVNAAIDGITPPPVFLETDLAGKLPHAEDNACAAALQTILNAYRQQQDTSRFDHLTLCVTHPICLRCACMILTHASYNNLPIKSVVIDNGHLGATYSAAEKSFVLAEPAPLPDFFQKHFYSSLGAFALFNPTAFLNALEVSCYLPPTPNPASPLPIIEIAIYDYARQETAPLLPFGEAAIWQNIAASKKIQLIEGLQDMANQSAATVEKQLFYLEHLFHRTKILPEAVLPVHKDGHHCTLD